MKKQQEQKDLLDQIDQILASTPEIRLALRQVIKLLHNRFEYFDWTGIYLLKENILKLADYCGAPSSHTEIPVGKGICGSAVALKATQNIPDVSVDSRYLACSLETKSEIVVPIISDDRIWGEIDIDSHQSAAFDRTDEQFLQQVADRLAAYFYENTKTAENNRIKET